MTNSFEIIPQPLNSNNNGQQRCCLIKQITASGESIEKQLWFLYPAEVPMPEDDNCDAYLLAALLPAMQVKADISVRGTVSSELLANLNELQYVWKRWCPEQYALIDIKVEQVRDNEIRADGAVAAFSGGADAQFTTYRHAMKQAGYSTQTIRAGVLVHGFDIPLSDLEGFAGAESLAAKALADLGLDLFSVTSNVRELWDINWEHHCGTALAAVLSGLSSYAGAGLIGSSDPYGELYEPWGSHPITDPLMSSGVFKIIHDGAGFGRAEKVEVIAKWPKGMQNLRVCWQGSERDRNCGVCEKCVRTRLNFLVAGSTNPECFSTPLTAKHIKNIKLSNESIAKEWQGLLDEMVAREVDSKWIRQVKKVLKRKPGPAFASLFPAESRRRLLIKKLRDKQSLFNSQQ